MVFLTNPIRVRLHIDQVLHIEDFKKKFPEKYKNMSDVIRSAINYFHTKIIKEKKVIGENGNRQDTSSRRDSKERI